MHKCKITVLKRTVNQDLIDEYLNDTCKDISSCKFFRECQDVIGGGENESSRYCF